MGHFALVQFCQTLVIFTGPENSAVCAKSSDYVEKNCNCYHYEERYDVGPYCLTWDGLDPPYCYISGGPDGRFCPGAFQTIDTYLYWTDDIGICNRSQLIGPIIPLDFGVKEHFSGKEILLLTVYILGLLLGTIGNALVIKQFVSFDAHEHPGSRFVIVLAGVDFVSSIWLPFLDIVYTFYDFKVIKPWPLGQILCVPIVGFNGIFFFCSAWLLVAISLERARAIYKPFARKLSKKYVVLVSILTIVFSISLSVYEATHTQYRGKSFAYLDGTTYEYAQCVLDMSDKSFMIDAFLTSSLGILLPMVIIAIVYIIIYLRLKKQAQIRRTHSSHDSNNQMVKFSRTFTTLVIVFYICYLPATILSLHHFKNYVSYNNHHFNTALSISNFLMNINCCINPLIYSKIHVKIYKAAAKCIRTYKIPCPCTQESISSSQPQQRPRIIRKTSSVSNEDGAHKIKDQHKSSKFEPSTSASIEMQSKKPTLLYGIYSNS